MIPAKQVNALLDLNLNHFNHRFLTGATGLPGMKGEVCDEPTLTTNI